MNNVPTLLHQARRSLLRSRPRVRGQRGGVTAAPMFDSAPEVLNSLELLAQIGLDGRAIRHILDEPAPFDPRDNEAE